MTSHEHEPVVSAGAGRQGAISSLPIHSGTGTAVRGQRSPNALLILQRSVGNRAVSQLMGRQLVLQRQPLPHGSTVTPQLSTLHPESFPTFEGWIATFRTLQTFDSQDTVGADAAPYERWRREHHRRDPARHTRRPMSFQVFGDRPADRAFEAGAGPHARFDRPTVGDSFIDHPTEEWLRRHLPPNLIATAYQLPSDCADIAFILRHVWLSAHHRLERHVLNGRPVVIGDRRGAAAPDRVRRQILGPVSSWSYAELVQPYLSAAGRPLQDFGRVQALLHPGDVLVWAHHRPPGVRPDGRLTAQTGGHVQTVMQVVREGGRVTSLRVVQGNQPIFQEQAEDITSALGTPAVTQAGLRATPGRRIEAQELSASELGDDAQGRWTWGDSEHTTLVAAGPPVSVRRPAARRGAGSSPLERWLPALRRARAADMVPTLSGALADLRSAIEGGAATTPPGMDPMDFARRLGAVVAARLRTLADRPEAPTEADVLALVGAFTGVDQESAVAARVRAGLAQVSSAVGNSGTASSPVQRWSAQIPPSPSLVAQRICPDVNPVACTAPVATPQTGPRPPTDWAPVVACAADADLEPLFTRALTDAAALVAARHTVHTGDAECLGRVAGERLWALAHLTARSSTGTTSPSLGVEHFRRLGRMRGAVSAHAGPLAGIVDRSFETAARGMSTLRFSSLPGQSNPVRILVTGFDPFDSSGSTMPWATAGPANWNPSGAVALALDGEQVPLPGGRVALVEAAVFPVDFRDFDQGIVERAVGSVASQVDAVITISLDPNLGVSAAVRLEQYAVGSRKEGGLRRIGAPQMITDDIVPIIRSQAPLSRIRRMVGRDPMGIGSVPTPTVGIDTTLRFAATEIRFMRRLLDQAVGGHMRPAPQISGGELTIRDERALRVLLQALTRDVTGTGVTIRLGRRSFRADVVRGPGGNFLSNEIAFRSQRGLRNLRSPAARMAFHIHTSGAPAHQAVTAADRATARNQLTETVTRTVRAVAVEIIARRRQQRRP